MTSGGESRLIETGQRPEDQVQSCKNEGQNIHCHLCCTPQMVFKGKTYLPECGSGEKGYRAEGPFWQ